MVVAGTIMNKIFWILCFTLSPAIASATNFDLCVNEAKTNHAETAEAGYTVYKCEGMTAEKLAARPDECAGGAKPLLRSLSRKVQQFDDGLYAIMSWTAGKCTGSCKTRSYDSRDTNYLCEVRIYGDGGPPTESNRQRMAPGPGAASQETPGPPAPGPPAPAPGGPAPDAAGPGAPGPDATGPTGGRQTANETRLRRRPPPPGPDSARPGAPGPGAPGSDAAGPPGGRRAAHEARLNRRPPLAGPAWAPPTPRGYSRYNRFSRYYSPSSFPRRPWIEPPPIPPAPVPYEYEEYADQPYPQSPRCGCSCRGCY
jgi:hypothetical protein